MLVLKQGIAYNISLSLSDFISLTYMERTKSMGAEIIQCLRVFLVFLILLTTLLYKQGHK